MRLLGMMLIIPLIYFLDGTVVTAQTGLDSAATDVLATVRLPVAVMAGGTRLQASTYEVRLTQEQPAPLSGQPVNTQRWVELMAGGKVVARDIAEVIRDEDLPDVGASSRPVRSGVRVEMLKGGEFLRISVKRDRVRYLIHLPIAP